MAATKGAWVAVVHYSIAGSNGDRGGSWMAGVGNSRAAAKRAAIARHEFILGAPPPAASQVDYWRDEKPMGSGRL